MWVVSFQSLISMVCCTCVRVCVCMDRGLNNKIIHLKMKCPRHSSHPFTHPHFGWGFFDDISMKATIYKFVRSKIVFGWGVCLIYLFIRLTDVFLFIYLFFFVSSQRDFELGVELWTTVKRQIEIGQSRWIKTVTTINLSIVVVVVGIKWKRSFAFIAFRRCLYFAETEMGNQNHSIYIYTHSSIL